MKTSPCKGCGKPILWAKTRDGKRIPLDPKPPVYMTSDPDSDFVLCERQRRSYVSHFATCPEANQFSASKKKES